MRVDTGGHHGRRRSGSHESTGGHDGRRRSGSHESPTVHDARLHMTRRLREAWTDAFVLFPVRDLDLLARATPADQPWIRSMQEEAFAVSGEADRRTAISLADDMLAKGVTGAEQQ